MVQYLDTPDTAQKIFLDLPRRREALGVSRSHGLNIQSSPGQYYMYYYYTPSPSQYITITHTAHFLLYTLTTFLLVTHGNFYQLTTDPCLKVRRAPDCDHQVLSV